MRNIRVGDISVAVEDRASDSAEAAPAVLFVHGLGGSLFVWWAQLAACDARGYRGVAYDQRGAGLSDKPGGPYSVELWADDLVGLLDALEIERAALVGHSVGCMVAEQAALRLGERCWALAVIGGALAWPREAGPMFVQRAEAARAGRMDEVAQAVAARSISDQRQRSDPVLYGLVLRLVASNDPEGYALSALATGEGEMESPGNLACPLLAIAGSEDVVGPPEAAQAIASAAPKGVARTIDGAAHWCMLEQPEAVNQALFAYLDRHRPT